MTPQHFDFPKITDLLKRYGVRLAPHKSQHFMHNFANCQRIAEHIGVTKEHIAIEAGAGLGNLTTALSQKAGKVISVELDTTFKSWHQELQTHFDNLEFLYQDFLTVDLEEAVPQGLRPIAVGNLPYQITAPILFKLIESKIKWEKIGVVVQYEVAERIAAGPKTRRATALTYKLAFEYNSEIVMKFGPKEFIPPPRVNSAALVLTPVDSVPFSDAAHRTSVHKLISGIFQHRRRTLSNALMLCNLAQDRDHSDGALNDARIDPKARPETLDLDDILRLEGAISGR